MTWKAKSDTTHCEYLYSARVIASSFNCWPTTQIFPRRDLRNSSWTICVLLCPQNFNNPRRIQSSFIHTVSEIFISDPKMFSTTYTSRLIIHLFIPCTNYSDCIQSSKTAVDSERNIHTWSYFHTGSEFTLCRLLSQGFIRTGSYLFIPDPILFMPDLKLLICCWLFQRFWILLLSWLFIRKLFVPGLKIRRWSQVTDWFRINKKVTGLNISERVNTSPFLLKQNYKAISHATEFNYGPVKMFIFT